jgi:hypothetical protein
VANYVLKNGHDALDYCGGSHALPYLAHFVNASYNGEVHAHFLM